MAVIINTAETSVQIITETGEDFKNHAGKKSIDSWTSLSSLPGHLLIGVRGRGGGQLPPSQFSQKY